jgi:hypothetical protein
MKKRKPKKSPPKEADPKTPLPAQASNKPLDFGGLPQRDLKKNLGCG